MTGGDAVGWLQTQGKRKGRPETAMGRKQSRCEGETAAGGGVNKLTIKQVIENPEYNSGVKRSKRKETKDQCIV